jgi:hypothetical protein
VAPQSLVRKDTGRTYFHEIAAELAFKSAILESPVVDAAANAKNVEIFAAGVILVESHAAVALDTTVHLMVDERPQILIAVCALGKSIFAVVVPCHDCHVLEMTLTPFVANRAIMRMIHHEPFKHALAELLGLGVVN